MSNPLPKHLVAAAQAFRAEILAQLKDDSGVHAESAVAAAARMSGMYMLRSFDLDLSDPAIVPGTPILSENANQAGPGYVQLLAGVCGGVGVKFNSAKAEQDIPEENRPHGTVLETETQLEPAFEKIRRAHHLPDEGAARACTVAAALLIRDTQAVLDPGVAFAIAAYGLVEGSKTAPVPRSS